MAISGIEQDKSFTAEIKLPLSTMYFGHELSPKPLGTEVVHTIAFSGFLGPVSGKLIGNKLKKEQSRTMAALKKEVENK